jgi:hypothetical protein
VVVVDFEVVVEVVAVADSSEELVKEIVEIQIMM